MHPQNSRPPTFAPNSRLPTFAPNSRPPTLPCLGLPVYQNMSMDNNSLLFIQKSTQWNFSPCCLHQSQSSKTFVVRRIHGSKSQVLKASCSMQSELLEPTTATHMSEATRTNKTTHLEYLKATEERGPEGRSRGGSRGGSLRYPDLLQLLLGCRGPGAQTQTVANI